jgi:ABC-type multidrug transport system permease subunit
MDMRQLKSKGWSAAEIDHAARIMTKAEGVKHPHVKASEHAHLWMLVLAILLASTAFSTLLFPLMLFAHWMFGLLLMALAGAGIGMMYTHGLRSLRIGHAHHLTGFIVIAILSLLSATLIIGMLQERFMIIPGVRQGSALLFALALTIGIAIPYFLERRLHGGSDGPT